jgi:2-oxoglutarate ferredoxin oxidoreductase subunit alpha
MSGDGTIAAGGLLNDALAEAGFSILAFDSYPAEIRGFGRCITRSRITGTQPLALSDKTDVLISLDDKQSISRIPILRENGAVLFDNHPPAFLPEGESIAAHVGTEMQLFGVPFGDLASGASGSLRGRNLAALGAFASLFGVQAESFHQAIEKKFGPKGEAVLDANLKCFDAGFEYGLKDLDDGSDGLPKLERQAEGSEASLLSGNVAIARAALDAGISLYFGYPITPATPIMEYLAKELPKTGGKVVQMEDEISSIGAVLGSFYAGKRAMTATSGPGLALMTELITHGVMAEIPAVILDAQRGGPATGLPTKTEQSDLHAAVYGGPGDSPRIVLAPSNVLECYQFTLKSFQLAEKYQIPVILLTSFYLDNRVETLRLPSRTETDTGDWNVYPDDDSKGNYRRFEITESGISPRALPGSEGFIFTTTGLEHSERGIPEYGGDNHMRMSEKRHRKIASALPDLPPPREFLKNEKPDLGVISWGPTFGTALEAVEKAQEEGLSVAALKITSLFPYHAEAIGQFMQRCGDILIPELNFQGQLANLIGHLHRKEVIRLNQVTGSPMEVGTIFDKIRSIVD